MSSKKVSHNFNKEGKGTRTTVYERDNGDKRTVVQKASRGPLGGTSATSIISEKNSTRRK